MADYKEQKEEEIQKKLKGLKLKWKDQLEKIKG